MNDLVEQPITFSLLGNIKNKKILDAGCGSGIYTKLLAKKGGKVSALDLSKTMLDIAKEYCKGYGIVFRRGSIDNIPYKSNSFDIVVAPLVIHYLKNPEKAFNEFNRVLKKKGVLIFSTHNPLFVAKEGIWENKSFFEYLNEGKYEWYMHVNGKKEKMISYRIPYEKLFDMLYKNKFIVEKFKEPYLNKNKKILKKHMKKYIGFPIFITLKCRKLD